MYFEVGLTHKYQAMVITKSLNRNLLSLLIPILLFGATVILISSNIWATNDDVILAISVDLLLTIPIIYFLSIRTTPIPNTTVIPIMVIGLLIGSLLLPEEHQTYINLFKTWVLPIVEISVLSYIVLKVRKAIRLYDSQKDITPDFYTVLKSVCTEIMPKALVMPFATEVAVFYYGFVSWRSRKLENHEFTYHKKSGTPALLFAFIFIIAIETFAIHLLLAEWNSIVAWVLTGLSIYTGFQVIGFARSLSKRPISVMDQNLYLRYGILNEVIIPISDIVSVVQSRSAIDTLDKAVKLSPLGDLESHNVLISVCKVHTLTGLYGIKKRFKHIALYVDNPNEFVAQF